MEEILQHILFVDKELTDHWRLYYNTTRPAIIEDESLQKKVMHISASSFVGFNTYFNSCTAKKWIEYTNVQQLKLRLVIRGNCIIHLFGNHLYNNHPMRNDFSMYHINNEKSQECIFTYPKDLSDSLISFEIEAQSECQIIEGQYLGVYSAPGNNVEMALCTTTCRKEKFIIKNVELVYNELIKKKCELSEHFKIHIVDNGKTLTKENFPNDSRIILHANNNTGGSGGFARGMIEAMRQSPVATNVLLMDDDVLIQPESIYRTYVLLKHELKKFTQYFISGAMFFMEEKSLQKEDIGTVTNEAYFEPVKKITFDQEQLWGILKNETKYPSGKNEYAAWWYCCIPMETIKKKGLPLPIFVRCDDVEYGLRCKPGFITMNGICIWHLGFAGKFNASMDFYQVDRNLLIVKDISNSLKEVDVIKKIRLDFRRHMLKFDYSTAELVIRALEDYLKGPEFIMCNNGERIFINNSKLNHVMEPLEKYDNIDGMLEDPYRRMPRPFLQKWWYRITYNGQRLWNEKHKDFTSIPFTDIYQPEKIACRNVLLAVNVDERTCYWLRKDKLKYRQLMKRYKNALRNYKGNHEKIASEYLKQKARMQSVDFWLNYLEIE